MLKVQIFPHLSTLFVCVEIVSSLFFSSSLLSNYITYLMNLIMAAERIANSNSFKMSKLTVQFGLLMLFRLNHVKFFELLEVDHAYD